MLSPFRPAWWLPGPHAMTLWGKFFRKRELSGLRLQRLPTPDGDELTLVSADTPAPGPVLLLLHGLEGGVRSHYVGGIWAVARKNGWQPHMLIFRTCDGQMNRARRTYHSGETTDLEFVVQRLALERPERPIGVVGVSLGGNVLLKWLGERGDAIPNQVRAAVAISTPFDLARSSHAIGSGFSRVYQWNFLTSLRKKALLKIAQYPELASADEIDGLRTMWQFDDRFTAPLHGFADAADYYARSSSLGFLAGIRRPVLLLSAYDDPFHTRRVLDDVERVCAANANLRTEFHRRGGHVGFVGGAPWRPTYYVDERIESFLTSHI